MIIEFGIDKNVTPETGIDFLENIGVLHTSDKKEIYEKSGTVYVSIEVDSIEFSKVLLNRNNKDNICCNHFSELGVGLFTLDENWLKIFIPFQNLKAIFAIDK